MIQTILIVLVAVVVLIVIIAGLALRYLRSDDSGSFDDVPETPRPPRRQQARDSGPVAAPEDLFAAERPARAGGGRGPAGFRESDTGPRAAVPDRTSGSWRSPGRAAPSPYAAEAPTASWESMSDVDYWTELAADNAAARRAESAQTERIDLRADPRSQSGPLARPQSGPLARPQSGPYARPQPGAPARVPDGPPAPADPGRRRHRAEDPLTSPSAPAASAATDSRPYRARRGAGRGDASGQQAAPASVTGPLPLPGTDYAPAAPPGARPDAAAPPPAPPAGPPVPAVLAEPRQPAVSAAANPYGSYVAPPAHSGPGYQPSGDTAGRGPGYREDTDPAPPAGGYRGQRRGPNSTDGEYGSAGYGGGRESHSRRGTAGRHRARARAADRPALGAEPGYGQDGYRGYGPADR